MFPHNICLRLTVDKNFRTRFTMHSAHKPFLPINQLHRTLATPPKDTKERVWTGTGHWDHDGFIFTGDSQHTLR